MLEWTEEYDDHDNTHYEASGPYQEEDGTVFYFRIDPVLRDNQMRFSTGRTDSELIPSWDDEDFPTVEEAKASCQAVNDHIRAELANM